MKSFAFKLPFIAAFFALVVSGWAAEGGRLELLKQIDYEQTSATGLRPVRFFYQLSLNLFPGLELVRPPARPPESVQVAGPGGRIFTLTRAGTRAYIFSKEVESQAALEAECPDGTYTLSASGFAGPVADEFALATGAGPARIVNFAQLQAWRGYGARVEWEPIAGATSEDALGISVMEPERSTSIGSHLSDASGGRIDGVATSAVITSALPMGKALTAVFSYRRLRTGWAYTVQFPLRLLGDIVVTAAGQAEFPANTREPATDSRVDAYALAFDATGHLCWTENYCVRKLARDGTITTLAGVSTLPGDTLGAGAAARFNNLSGIAADAQGFVYVSDSYNHGIKRVSGTGEVTRLAGPANGFAHADFVDGPAATARFRYPAALAVDASGIVYVSDQGGQALRRITPEGAVTTLVNLVDGPRGYADGPLAAARFQGIGSLATDPAGNLYLVDSGNRAVRMITPGGVVSTITKAPAAFNVYASIDGLGTLANDTRISGLARDASGNLYTFEKDTFLRRIAPDGRLFGVAGHTGGALSVDGMGASASFANPTGIAVDARGNIFIADRSRVRKIVRDAAAPTPPVITRHPAAQEINAGRSVFFSAEALGDNLTYQWRFKGEPIPGATQSTLLLRNLEANVGDIQAGYAVDVANAGGRAVSRVALLSVGRDENPARLANLSVRTVAGARDETLIVGFVVAREATAKPVLLRGIGPSLASSFGVAGAISDPALTLFRGSAAIGGNDDWGGAASVSDISIQIGAFALAPSSRDAALYAEALAGGGYSLHISGNQGPGIALAEVFDATASGAWQPATPRLVNVSARAHVGTGASIAIVGFVTRGGGASTVLIRAVGPGLAQFGVQGTLRDPQLSLHTSTTRIATNDDWAGTPQLRAAADAVGAFRLADPVSKDAALLVTLPPGNYTVQVSGAEDGTGVALVELYELP